MGSGTGVSSVSHVVTSHEIYERYMRKPEAKFAGPAIRRKLLDEPTGALAAFRHEVLERAKACFYGSGGTGMCGNVAELVAARAEQMMRFDFGHCGTKAFGGTTKVDWLG